MTNFSANNKHGFNRFLPPAYEVRGKVLFSQVSVSSHYRGGTPSQVRGVPHPVGVGVPHPRSRWGRGVPHPAGGGTPCQVQVGDTPFSWWGVPHPRSRLGVPHPSGRGYPISSHGWGTPSPIHDWMGYPPPPIHDWMGTPSPIHDWMGYPPCQEADQQSEHLLRSRRCASCVHAGGLFCFVLRTLFRRK